MPSRGIKEKSRERCAVVTQSPRWLLGLATEPSRLDINLVNSAVYTRCESSGIAGIVWNATPKLVKRFQQLPHPKAVDGSRGAAGQAASRQLQANYMATEHCTRSLRLLVNLPLWLGTELNEATRGPSTLVCIRCLSPLVRDGCAERRLSVAVITAVL